MWSWHWILAAQLMCLFQFTFFGLLCNLIFQWSWSPCSAISAPTPAWATTLKVFALSFCMLLLNYPTTTDFWSRTCWIIRWSICCRWHWCLIVMLMVGMLGWGVFFGKNVQLAPRGWCSDCQIVAIFSLVYRGRWDSCWRRLFVLLLASAVRIVGDLVRLRLLVLLLEWIRLGMHAYRVSVLCGVQRRLMTF